MQRVNSPYITVSDLFATLFTRLSIEVEQTIEFSVGHIANKKTMSIYFF